LEYWSMERWSVGVLECPFWPEGPGKLSPGFTLGFSFSPEALKGRLLTRAQEPRPEISAAPSGLLTLNSFSQGKPWAFLARWAKDLSQRHPITIQPLH
jgi:hypothetical protein